MVLNGFSWKYSVCSDIDSNVLGQYIFKQAVVFKGIIRELLIERIILLDLILKLLFDFFVLESG